MKQILNTFLLVWTAIGVSAQTYWRENIDTIPESGYYNIELSQEISGLGLNTLKIIDEKGKEVPYLLRSSLPVKEITQLDMYDLRSNTARDSTNTIIVHNKDTEISRFYLLMKKADVAKYVSIRGSNDLRKWFSVKQRSNLKSEYNPKLGEIAIVDFPKGDYTYYEITVVNNSNSPLNITGVGKLHNSSIYGQFIEFDPGKLVMEEDSYDNTVISMPHMPYPYYLSKLEIKAVGKGHYSRKARIIKNGHSKATFELSSKGDNVFYFNDLLIDNETYIEIQNQDNPALSIEDMIFSSMDMYVCAYLEGGNKYYIETNGNKYKEYDIQNFVNDIPKVLPVVKTSHLIQITPETTPAPEPVFFEKPLFLWGVIIVLGGLLILVCIRMMNEMKNKGD